MTREPFFVLHRWGKSERSNDLDILHMLLEELDTDMPDDEHVSVSVRSQDGWCLSAYVSGLLVFENVEDLSREPRHLRVGTREEAKRLMTLLAGGELAKVEREPWCSGSG